MTTTSDEALRPDRRARRRQETIREILDIARDVMTEEGVNGLSLAEVARRLGVKPPSLYKYFPSLMAIYDALFLEGQRENLEVMRSGMQGPEPGLDASGQWGLDNRALAELLFWRPVPSFTPSPEAFAVSMEMVELQRGALADAVAKGELGPGANDESAIYLVSTLIAGALGQAIANEPELPWGEGRFSSWFPTLMRLLPAAFPLEA